jgi:hypothetical protein
MTIRPYDYEDPNIDKFEESACDQSASLKKGFAELTGIMIGLEFEREAERLEELRRLAPIIGR